MSNNGLVAVYDANRAALLRFLTARIRDSSEAEDLLQDLWLKMSLATGPIAEPLSYLYRMADNLVLDRRRSAMRRLQRDDGWHNLATDAGGSSDQPSAERVLIGREQLALVAKALDDLGGRTAEIFRQFRIEGIGQRAIAEAHGISVSAVEKHLQRAYRAVLDSRTNFDAESVGSRRPIGKKDENGAND